MNDVARRLLTSEAKSHASSEELAYATERVCQKLLRYLSRLLGHDGSYALLRRSLKHAQTKFALLESVKTDPDTSGIKGLVESLRYQEPAATLEMCVGMIESFLALFASFVGEDLARKLVEEAFIDADERKATNKADNS
jgi:hypothetical protein